MKISSNRRTFSLSISNRNIYSVIFSDFLHWGDNNSLTLCLCLSVLLLHLQSFSLSIATFFLHLFLLSHHYLAWPHSPTEMVLRPKMTSYFHKFNGHFQFFSLSYFRTVTGDRWISKTLSELWVRGIRKCVRNLICCWSVCIFTLRFFPRLKS